MTGFPRRLLTAFAMGATLTAADTAAASENYSTVCWARSGTSKQGFLPNKIYYFGMRFVVNESGHASISEKLGDMPPELNGILSACDSEPKNCKKTFINNTLRIGFTEQAVATFNRSEYSGVIFSNDGDNPAGVGKCMLSKVAPRP